MKKTFCAALFLALVFTLFGCADERQPNISVPSSSDSSGVIDSASVLPDSSATEPTTVTLPNATLPESTTAEDTVVAEPTTVPEPTTVAEPTTVSEPSTEPADTTTTEPPVSTADSAEAAGSETPEVPFDFAESDLTAYFELGKYIGIEVSVAAAEPVTDADVNSRLADAVAALPAEAMVTDRAAEHGDTVNINFVGTMDGILFDGGSATGFVLTLGSNALIEGFEDGVCGMTAGEEKQLQLVFPDEYSAAYAGKTAVFTVTLNYIYPVPSDALAVRYWDAVSLDDYRATLQLELTNEAQTAFEIAKEEAAWIKALANSRVIQYPEDALNEAFESNVHAYEMLAAMYNMTYEELFPVFYGLSVEDAETILFDSAKNLIAQRLLLYSIARDMEIDASDEKFDADLAATAAVLGLESVDALVEQLGKSKTALKEDKLYAEIITRIVAEARFVVTDS